MAKGFAGTVFLTTDDCQKSYEELVARGVEFVETPEARPYGVDAGFRDPSGNSFRLTQLLDDFGWRGAAVGGAVTVGAANSASSHQASSSAQSALLLSSSSVTRGMTRGRSVVAAALLPSGQLSSSWAM